MPILEINNVTKQFGGLMALDEVSFRVEEGEIRGLIGPNGAGKSTMFKNIAGFYEPTRGSIVYQGTNIEGMKPHTIAEMGIVRTFQETTLFQELSVFENALVGAHIKSRAERFFRRARAGPAEATGRQRQGHGSTRVHGLDRAQGSARC